MTSPTFLTSTQFSDALNGESLRVTRLIQAAIMTGPSFFLIIIVAFSAQQAGELPHRSSGFEIMDILSMVHGVLFVLAILLAQFLSGVLFSPDRLGQDAGSIPADMLAAKCMAMQRTAIIVRLAILEGASFFGLAVCFLGVMNHVMQAEPSYWLNAVSTGLFLAYGVTTFPTKESLVEWYNARFSHD